MIILKPLCVFQIKSIFPTRLKASATKHQSLCCNMKVKSFRNQPPEGKKRTDTFDYNKHLAAAPGLHSVYMFPLLTQCVKSVCVHLLCVYECLYESHLKLFISFCKINEKCQGVFIPSWWPCEKLHGLFSLSYDQILCKCS